MSFHKWINKRLLLYQWELIKRWSATTPIILNTSRGEAAGAEVVRMGVWSRHPPLSEPQSLFKGNMCRRVRQGVGGRGWGGFLCVGDKKRRWRWRRRRLLSWRVCGLGFLHLDARAQMQRWEAPQPGFFHTSQRCFKCPRPVSTVTWDHFGSAHSQHIASGCCSGEEHMPCNEADKVNTKEQAALPPLWKEPRGALAKGS